MLAPNPNFKKNQISPTFSGRGRLRQKNRFHMELAGSGKKTGSVRNRSKAVFGGGSGRSGLETGWTGRFYRFRFGSCNTALKNNTLILQGSKASRINSARELAFLGSSEFLLP
jgi:hypothetical protein